MSGLAAASTDRFSDSLFFRHLPQPGRWTSWRVWLRVATSSMKPGVMLCKSTVCGRFHHHPPDAHGTSIFTSGPRSSKLDRGIRRTIGGMSCGAHDRVCVLGCRDRRRPPGSQRLRSGSLERKTDNWDRDTRDPGFQTVRFGVKIERLSRCWIQLVLQKSIPIQILRAVN